MLTFFNHKSGVGKTSLVYHLSWMFAKLHRRAIALDRDPQANLTAAFRDEDRLEYLWEHSSDPLTIYQCLKPLTEVGGLREPILTPIDTNLHLLPGDVMLAGFEET